MMAIYDDYHKILEKLHKTMKKYADADRSERLKYLKGDLIILIGKIYQAADLGKNSTMNDMTPSKLQKISRK
jgi:hypothetical protein